MGKFKAVLSRQIFGVNQVLAGAAVAGAVTVGWSGLAGAVATYDLSSVVTSLQGELTANIPTILGAVGVLIALGLGLKLVRKFIHV